MPAPLSEWRRARADVAHDWLERRLLPILNTSGSPEESHKRALLCTQAWREEIQPRLKSALSQIPDCFLPRVILARCLCEAELQKLDMRAMNADVGNGIKLRDIGSELHERAAIAHDLLNAFVEVSDERQRKAAFAAVMSVRVLLQTLPRSVIIL